VATHVESRDHGAKAVLDAARRLGAGGVVLRVGVLEGDADHGGVTVGEVAAFHEFGTATIPQRSFIRAWYDENLEANKTIWRAVMARAMRGEITREQGLNQLGALFVGQIQKRIADGIPPELAESTIRQKGSSVPLIDTGQLRSSITYQVG